MAKLYERMIQVDDLSFGQRISAPPISKSAPLLERNQIHIQFDGSAAGKRLWERKAAGSFRKSRRASRRGSWQWPLDRRSRRGANRLATSTMQSPIHRTFTWLLVRSTAGFSPMRLNSATVASSAALCLINDHQSFCETPARPRRLRLQPALLVSV
jgi:hypothetical protein